GTEHIIFSFSKTHTPALTVTAPITLDIETLDCFSNQLRDLSDSVEKLDWDRINPATGPIYISGTAAGDALKVTINRIDLDAKGTVCCMEGEGSLGHRLHGAHQRIVPVENGFARYLDRFAIPVKKMIGVIGVAPLEGAINNGTPGAHGGNMDTLLITEGATIYFPVATPGALFALGDVHAVMGDGEIGVSGLEIPARINLTLDVVRGKAPVYPVLENAEAFAVIVSQPTTDQAIALATELMCDFLVPRMDIALPEIVMLMSMVGNVQISQVVDPQKTVRFIFPKRYMNKPIF
ncbi:MAG: acetamidase/formamidase family protein, partial [Clostridiales bacterium]